MFSRKDTLVSKCLFRLRNILELESRFSLLRHEINWICNDHFKSAGSSSECKMTLTSFEFSQIESVDLQEPKLKVSKVRYVKERIAEKPVMRELRTHVFRLFMTLANPEAFEELEVKS